MPESDLTAERVRQLFSYDSDTGLLTWRTGQRAGAVAGTRVAPGYIRITIDREIYSAHRLVWVYVHGRWPREHIDHINGQRDDNRLLNLREASHAQNCQNAMRRRDNSSGHKGVSWHRQRQKWQAQIAANGRRWHLGTFETAEEAGAAYRSAAIRLHGKFSNIS